jgi:DNA-binding NtrC family response regulator
MVLAVGSNQPEPFNVRLICASNEDLAEKTQSGGFRQDLLYRINTIEICLPPLRERQGDVELLLHWYLKFYGEKYQSAGLQIAPAQLQQLCRFDWPGNVRQLAHAVERAVVLAEDGVLDFSYLLQPVAVAAAAPSPQDFVLEEVEERTIRQALQFTRGNISQSAKMLGLTRAALYRRMEKYQL